MRSGTIIDDRFRIERLAGTGGMGAVYKALDLDRAAAVAVKIARHELPRDQHGGQRAARIGREVHALAGQLGMLGHPGIVEYIAHGTTVEGQPYLVMEWLEGRDLGERIQQGPLTQAQCIDVGLQVCRALAAVHGCGIIHRDIKPSNLFLVGGELTRVKLIDFGLVHLDASVTALTRTGMLVGTPSFIAPEQARGEPDIDARVDLYSLGAVLFACLTQRPPFTGAHYLAVLGKLALEQAPRVGELRPREAGDISPALEAVIERLLAKDADERPASASEVAAMLAAIDPAERSTVVATGPHNPVSRSEQRFLSVLVIAQAAAVRDDSARSQLGTSSSALPSALPSTLPSTLIVEHGADVARLSDGTVMAVFLAQADPAQAAAQAARCALAVQAAGLAAPMVVATGRGQIAERVPVGDVIDRAVGLLFDLRSMNLATVDLDLDLEGPQHRVYEIALDEVTAGLVESRFAVRRNDDGAHVLLGERPQHLMARSLSARQTACVGRERELAALAVLFDECVAESEPRVALVTGPVGMGKSRLAHELVHRLSARSQPPRIWSAQGDSMRAGASLGLVAQIIAQAMVWDPAASLSERQACLLQHISMCLPADSADRVAVFLGELAGTPFPDRDRVQLREARRDPRLMYDQMRQAWEDWLAAEAELCPIMLVLDDLHWGDLPTVRFVDAALRSLARRPLFVLALARPEVHDTFPELWAARNVEQRSLRPLSRRACLELAHHAGLGTLASEALDRLIERSGGNPFYMEELLRHAASGSRAELPEALLAMVGARLHALPADERRALRAASVFGRRFWTGGVAALLGEEPERVDLLLARLAEQDLVSRERRSRFADTAEHVFRHELTRDAAYAMLTAEDRVNAHCSAGEWLEQAGETSAMALAEHYWRGHGPRRALPWFQRAAEQALEANDVQAVIERAERAIACGAQGEILGALRLLQAEAHNWRTEYQAARVCAAEAMQRLARGSTAWALAAHQAVWAAGALGHANEIAAIAEEARQRAAEFPDEAHLMTLAQCVSYCALFGDNRLLELQAWIDAHQPEPRTCSLVAIIHRMRANLAYLAARPAEAADAFAAAIEHWRAAGNERLVCMDQTNLGVVLRELGQYEQSIAIMRACIAWAVRSGVEHILVAATGALAIALARQGELAEARQLMGQSAASSGNQRHQAFWLIYRAQIMLFEAAPTMAIDEAARDLAHIGQDIEPGIQGFALAVRAQALLALDRADEALDAARAGMRIAEATSGLGEGDALLRLVHAEALAATGATAAAHAAIQAAAAHLLARAERIQDPDWRQSFLQRVAEHQRTLALAREWTI